MKNRFLLLSSLLVSGSLLAQAPSRKANADHLRDLNLTEAKAPQTVNEGISNNYLADGLGTVLFTEDFANGYTAQGWTSSTLASYNANAVWVYRGPSTTPNNTVGSQGAYAGSSTPILSPTDTNGFMIFDSDWYDNGGTAGAFGQGTAPAPHGAALTTPEIDCSGETGVILSFNSYYRQYDAHGYVMVSTDSFATMDTIYDASDFHDVNTAGPADEVVKIDITESAAGQTGVQIRFLFLAAGNTSPSGYYFWMFDDVNVLGAADFDVEVQEVFYKGAGGNTSATAELEDHSYATYYDRIPASQAANSPLTFAAAIRSLSGATFTGVGLTASVTGPETFSGTSNTATYSSVGTLDTLNATTTFTPSTVGAYEVSFTVAGDSADDYPSDNVVTRTFNVDENTMSWNDGTVDGGISWSSGGQSIFSRFELTSDDTISGVEYAIWSSSTFLSDDQAAVTVGIWPVTGGTMAGNGSPDFANPIFSELRVMSSSEYTDGTNDNTIFVSTGDPIALPAGEYLVGYINAFGSTIRTAQNDRSNDYFNTWLSLDGGATLAGWVSENPIIGLRFFSSETCANSDLAVSGFVDCYPSSYELVLDITSTGGEGTHSYEWSNGETTEDITVTEQDVYSVTVTDEALCKVEMSFNASNDSTNCNLSVADFALNANMSVYPNPNNGNFNLAFNNLNGEYDVTVVSAIGQVVATRTVNVNSTYAVEEFNAANLGAGIYFVTVESNADASKAVLRVIVK